MKTTEEKNRMIAEFMGARPVEFNDGSKGHSYWNEGDKGGRYGSFPDGSTNYFDYSKGYNTSWDWLMPVVEKIENIGFSVKIQRLKTSIHPLCEDKELFGIVCGDVSKKLEITYDTIVQFIEFYNEQK